MKEIIFSTGNKNKIREATNACGLFDIKVIAKKLDIDEIQSDDPLKIAKHKASRAYELLNKPVVINDSFWNIPALNGFPGGYMKEVMNWLSAEDFIRLMTNKTDRKICVTECVAYKDNAVYKIFKKDFWGEIANKPFGRDNNFESVAIFNGKTLSEYHKFGQQAFNSKDYIWNDFAKWFSDYNEHCV